MEKNRKEYKLTEKEYETWVSACQALNTWRCVCEKLGFDWLTMQIGDDENGRYVTGIPMSLKDLNEEFIKERSGDAVKERTGAEGEKA